MNGLPIPSTAGARRRFNHALPGSTWSTLIPRCGQVGACAAMPRDAGPARQFDSGTGRRRPAESVRCGRPSEGCAMGLGRRAIVCRTGFLVRRPGQLVEARDASSNSHVSGEGGHSRVHVGDVGIARRPDAGSATKPTTPVSKETTGAKAAGRRSARRGVTRTCVASGISRASFLWSGPPNSPGETNCLRGGGRIAAAALERLTPTAATAAPGGPRARLQRDLVQPAADLEPAHCAGNRSAGRQSPSTDPGGTEVRGAATQPPW